MTDPTRAAPDPPAGQPLLLTPTPPVTLPALVARVRGEGERFAFAREKHASVTTEFGAAVALARLADMARNSALPADALALARRAERLEAAVRHAERYFAAHAGVARLAGRVDQADDLEHHRAKMEAALADEPAEGDS